MSATFVLVLLLLLYCTTSSAVDVCVASSSDASASMLQSQHTAGRRPMVLYESLRVVTGKPDEFRVVTTTFLFMATRLQSNVLSKQAQTLALMAHNGRLPLAHNHSIVNPRTIRGIVELYLNVALAGIRPGDSESGADSVLDEPLEDPGLVCTSSLDELHALMELARDNIGQGAPRDEDVEAMLRNTQLLKRLQYGESAVHLPKSLDVAGIVEIFRACSVDGDGGSSHSRSSGNFAVVTLVTGGPWLRGALVLGRSLRPKATSPTNTTPAFDMIAMCYDMSDDERALVELASWRCISPPVIENPWKASPWKWDYHLKIQPFNLTEYDRVLVLDSDMIVVDVDGLTRDLFYGTMAFPATVIYAVKDCVSASLERTNPVELNGGLLLLTPDRTIFESLIALAPSTPSTDMGGQGFFSLIFKNRILWLPERFNYLRHSLCVLDFDRTFFPEDASSLVDPAPIDPLDAADPRWSHLVHKHLASVAVIHFHFKPKPWECPQDKLGDCGHVLGGGTSNVIALNELWFERIGDLNLLPTPKLASKLPGNLDLKQTIRDEMERALSLIFRGDLLASYSAVCQVGRMLAGEAAEEKELVTTVVDWLQQTQEETYIHVAILAMLKGEHAMISEVDLHHLFLKAVYGLGFTDAAVTFANVSRRKFPNEAFKLQ